MLVGHGKYILTFTVNGETNTACTYQIDLSSLGALEGQVVVLDAGATGSTWFSVGERTLAFRAPASFQVGASTTVVTSANAVSGSVLVYPPLNVSARLLLEGNNGIIGEAELAAGQPSLNYHFDVSSEQALTGEQAAAALAARRPVKIEN